jgi:rare lipoprotein A
VLRVNDRGPFSKGRVLDVSKRAAQILGYEKQGTAKVKIEVLKEESKYIASVAKSGKDTSGYEIALNKPNVSTHSKSVRVASSAKRAAYKAQNNSYQNTATAPNSYSRTSTSPYAPQRIEPAAGRTSANGVQVQRVESQPLSVSTETGLKRVTPGRVDNGNFYPDPVINEVPVTDSKIFIQAGSFSNLQNAENLKAALSKYSQTAVFPVHVNGKQFYRVRLGPISSVDNADRVLASMSNAGHTNAIIIVD